MPKVIANKVWKMKIDDKLVEVNLDKAFYDFEQHKDENEKEKYQKAKEMKEPLQVLNDASMMVLFGEWLFHATSYELSLSPDKLKLILLESIDKERTKFERLKNKYSKTDNEIYNKREPIPEEVRIFVWRRDGGRCVKCGSQDKLEYDHIIPLGKGGSNTSRNIQILCEKCNREKKDSI